MRAPLRWAGSKRLLLKRLALLAPANFDRYVEPFAGSAALFFRLQPRAALLADLNSELISFYQVLSTRPAHVAREAAKFDADGDDYYEVRAMNPEDLSATRRAARFLYLNRFCFNGVYRTNSLGKFNVPRGTRTGALPGRDELMLASVALRAAKIQACDFESTLRQARMGDFVYIDPPYFTRLGIKPGEYGYGSLGGLADLDRLIEALRSLSSRGVRYLLSYSHSRTLIRALQPEWVGYVRVNRTVAAGPVHRKESRELLITNYTPTMRVEDCE